MKEGKSFDPIWEEIFQREEWGKYPAEHVIRLVARSFYRAPDRSKVRLLDLGSGPGASSWFMAREGFAVSAIDGSETAIRRLRERLTKDGLSCDARVGDLATLPWDDATFDGVIDNAAIYANPRDACHRMVAEVKRVLKPGGVFGSALFTDRSWGYGLGECIAPGTFVAIPEGPLASRGLSTFFGRTDVDVLFSPFESVKVETLGYTMDGHLIELGIVTARAATA